MKPTEKEMVEFSKEFDKMLEAEEKTTKFNIWPYISVFLFSLAIIVVSVLSGRYSDRVEIAEKRVQEVRMAITKAETEIKTLKAENIALKAENETLKAELAAIAAELGEMKEKAEEVKLAGKIKLGIVGKGEGPWHAVFRQLRKDPTEFGFTGSLKDRKAVREWAEKTTFAFLADAGYIGLKDGKIVNEVRIRKADEVSLVLRKQDGVFLALMFHKGKLLETRLIQRPSLVKGEDYGLKRLQPFEYIHTIKPAAKDKLGVSAQALSTKVALLQELREQARIFGGERTLPATAAAAEDVVTFFFKSEVAEVVVQEPAPENSLDPCGAVNLYMDALKAGGVLNEEGLRDLLSKSEQCYKELQAKLH